MRLMNGWASYCPKAAIINLLEVCSYLLTRNPACSWRTNRRIASTQKPTHMVSDHRSGISDGVTKQDKMVKGV